MVRNLTTILESATAEQWSAGLAWYARFQALAADLAERHGVTVDEAAGVLAIVSPRVTVGTSVAIADDILGAWVAGGQTAAASVGGGLGERIDAAARWLAGDARPLALDADGRLSSSRKVRSFYRNIMGDPDAVTVDVWATRAAGATIEQPSGGGYVLVAEAYRTVARRFGVSPRDVQAVVWCAVRSDIDAAEELAALRASLAATPVAA